MPDAVPFVSNVTNIEPDWIDHNGHLNMAYYMVLFDRGLDDAFASLGLGPNYAASRRLTTYAAEIHVRYVRELHLSDRVTVSFQLLEHDSKRLRSWKEIRQHPEGWLAASCESLTLHIDMSGPKVTQFPPDILANLEAMQTAHSVLPMPQKAGNGIAMKLAR